MILYIARNNRIVRQLWQPGDIIPDETVWIDMNSPTRRQEEAVEDFLGIDVPTREEMHAIEVSDRLYHENGNYFMTATIITKMDTAEAEAHAVTFIIVGDRLVTLRYSDPIPFIVFAAQIDKLPKDEQGGPALLLGLLDSITNRVADVCERIAQELDGVTKLVFGNNHACATAVNYQNILREIGHSGDLLSKVRESLMTLSRLVAFGMQCSRLSAGENMNRLQAQGKDIGGLSDHVNYLSTKVNFLLDATLGMISIEQNNIIKIFSVAAVMFMPPTMIASIYGMNFDFMPELHWSHGYPFTLLLMVISAAVPYYYFKRKKWL